MDYIDVSHLISGVSNLRLDALSGFNRGMTSLDTNQLGLIDLGIKGHWAFVWTKLPQFMVNTEPQLTKNFKIYSELCASEFSGIPDLSVEEANVEMGRMKKSVGKVTGVKMDAKTFSYNVAELQNRMVSKFINTWLTGMSDLNSGRAHHNGELDKSGSRRQSINETGEIMFFNMTSDFNYVTNAFLITNIYPTKGPMAHNNGDGVGDIAYTLDFSGYFVTENNIVNQEAQAMLNNLKTLRTAQFSGNVKIK